MKKMEYMTPEMEVVELKLNKILMASGSEPGDGGSGDGIDE